MRIRGHHVADEVIGLVILFPWTLIANASIRQTISRIEKGGEYDYHQTSSELGKQIVDVHFPSGESFRSADIGNIM